jgi:hypothetical protein
MIQGAENMEQGAFTDSGFAHHRQTFAFAQIEIDTA